MAKNHRGKSPAIIITLLRIILIVIIIFIIFSGSFLLIKIVRSENRNNSSSEVIPSRTVVSSTVSASGSISSAVFDEPKRFDFIVPKNKQVKTRRELYSDGSVRGEYEYDEFGRLRYFKSHSSETITSVTYDSSFEVIETYTNEKHFGDEYYDSMKRLVRLNNLKNGCEYLYTYDDNGNLIKEDYHTTVDTSRFTDYTYDQAGRLIGSKNYINGSLSATYSYEYNEDSLLCTETYSFNLYDSTPETVISSYEYDELGRISNLHKSWASTEKYYCETYSYNASGLTCTVDYGTFFKNGLRDAGSSNGSIIYTYDSVGNILEKVTSLLNGITTYEKHEYLYDDDYCILKDTLYLNEELSSVIEYTYHQ